MNQRYEAKEPLAAGGRGEVLRGWDHQLGREVAIKRVRREVGNDDAVTLEALVTEARTLSTVQHPNVVTVYDTGKNDDGAFIVMELVKGETLEDIVARGALMEKDFESLVEQTLDGLLAAHQAGVIHLDLKPQNLMLTWLPSGGFQVKILDFGLAIAARQPVTQTMDQEGAIYGSIYFMAPEQFERRAVDARTDLYALGCVCYYALTQRYPFGGELGLQVVTSHLHHKRISLEKLRPDLSAFVASWVEWLMSRRMEDRPATTQEALTAFREKRLPKKEAGVRVKAVPVNVDDEATKVKRTLAVDVLGADQGKIKVKEKVKVKAEDRRQAPLKGKSAGLGQRVSTTTTVGRWSRYTIPVLALLTVIAGVWFHLKKRQGQVRLQRFVELAQSDVLAADQRDARLLLEFAKDEAASPAACLALSRMADSPAVNGLILAAAREAKGQIPTVNLMNVVMMREIKGGLELGLVRLKEADQQVAKAAWRLVGAMGGTSLLPDLLERCETLNADLEPFAEAALTGIIQRAEDSEAAAAPVVNAYQSGLGTGRYRALLVRVLGQSGSQEAFSKLSGAIQSGTVEVRRAAISALALWPSNEPLDLLTRRFEGEEDASARLMILRAAMTLVGQPGEKSGEELLVLARRLIAAAKERREKDQAAAVAARVEVPATVELLSALAASEPERSGALMALSKRVEVALAKVCKAEGGVATLKADKALIQAGSIEVREGSLSGWSSAGDAASWLVELPEPGRYEVRVNQSQTVGATLIYEVRIASERLVTQSVLTRDEKAEFKAYELGGAEIRRAGHHRLLLRVRQMPLGDVDFQVHELMLKKLP